MLEIIAASSLSHSIEQGLTPEQKNIVKQIVYAEGGFKLNPRTNFKLKIVTDYTKSQEEATLSNPTIKRLVKLVLVVLFESFDSESPF